MFTLFLHFVAALATAIGVGLLCTFPAILGICYAFDLKRSRDDRSLQRLIATGFGSLFAASFGVVFIGLAAGMALLAVGGIMFPLKLSFGLIEWTRFRFWEPLALYVASVFCYGLTMTIAGLVLVSGMNFH